MFPYLHLLRTASILKMSDQGPRKVVVPCSNLQKQITRLMSRSNIHSPLRSQVENLQKTLYSMEPMVYDMEQSVLVQNSPRHAFTEKFLPLVEEAKIAIGNLANLNNPSLPNMRNLEEIRKKLKTLFGEYVEAELRVLSSSIEEAGEQDEMVLQRLVIYLRSNIRNQLPPNTLKLILRNIAIILGSLKQESDKRDELLLLLNEVKLLLRFLNGDHGLDMPNLLLIREQELRKKFVTEDVMAQLKELDHQDKVQQRRKNKSDQIWFLFIAAGFLFFFFYPPQNPFSFVIITVAVCGAGYALFELIWDNPSTTTGTPHKSDDGTETSSNMSTSFSTRRCCQFSLEEIKVATNQFDHSKIIGQGGEATVYLAEICINSNKTQVAVKHLKNHSEEFEREIQTLSNIQHPNLVSLIGYCDESGHKILVYEYMEKGCLSNYLKKNSDISLSWLQRLKISLGAAQGLQHLHTETEEFPKGIIHRDVKPGNILVGENWVGKISDFGLFKLSHAGQEKSSMTTNLRGTSGYFAPEYINNRHITRKIDVYSFGVVLFQVLCRKMPWDREDESYIFDGKEDLGIWAQQNVDAQIREEMSENSVKIFTDIIGRSLQAEPGRRPTMDGVVIDLEKALES